MPVQAIRGATTVDLDEEHHLVDRIHTLLDALFVRNALTTSEIVSVLVTATDDIHSFHPATAVRRFGLADVPIMGARELEIAGGLARCVRLMLHVERAERLDVRHVFLQGARVLRPDLTDDDE
jgi:chorismate mutase